MADSSIFDPVQALKQSNEWGDVGNYSDQQLFQHLSDPVKFHQAFPQDSSGMSDDDLRAGMQRTAARNPAYVAPSVPNPIMKASQMQPVQPSTFARWTGGDPESNEVFKREISAAGSSIAGIPSALYHAAVDPATQEEKQNYGENFIRNIGPTGRLIERGIAQPVKNAADWYKQAFQGKVPDP